MAPAAFKKMFDPLPLPERFRDLFPAGLSFRPTQLRASMEDGGMMMAAADRFSGQYASILAPVTIMAGDADRIVDCDRQSGTLHDVIPGSRLKVFNGVGHMVHYAATSEIAAAIDTLALEFEPSAAA